MLGVRRHLLRGTGGAERGSRLPPVPRLPQHSGVASALSLSSSSPRRRRCQGDRVPRTPASGCACCGRSRGAGRVPTGRRVGPQRRGGDGGRTLPAGRQPVTPARGTRCPHAVPTPAGRAGTPLWAQPRARGSLGPSLGGSGRAPPGSLETRVPPALAQPVPSRGLRGPRVLLEPRPRRGGTLELPPRCGSAEGTPGSLGRGQAGGLGQSQVTALPLHRTAPHCTAGLHCTTLHGCTAWLHRMATPRCTALLHRTARHWRALHCSAQ